MTISMMITIEDELNEGLKQIAKNNRRSKRQEVIFAIEQYVERGGQPVNTTIWHPGAQTPSVRQFPTVVNRPPGDESA